MLVDVGQSSWVWSLLSSVGFNPSWFDVSGGDNQNGCFKFFFKIIDQFFVKVGQQSFWTSEVYENQSGWFFFTQWDFNDSVDFNSWCDFFIFSIIMVDGVLEGLSNLYFLMREIRSFGWSLLFKYLTDFFGFGHLWW